MINVFIDGSAGTTGLRIKERLAGRSDLKVMTLSDDARKDISERKKALNSCDVAFLCLPDEAAIESVGLIENPDVIVIDASTAHRTSPDWTYGFPELSQEHFSLIANSRRISVPGCHASGFCAIVYPLRSVGIMKSDYPASCYSLTGYSGGGKPMIAEYEEEARDFEYLSPRAYALGQKHKHLPEMTKVCKLDAPPNFIPVVADYYSGMLVSMAMFPALLGGVTAGELHEIYSAHYKDSGLIEVMPLVDASKGFMPSNGLSGTDCMRIYVCGNDDRIAVFAQFDNLGKGAGGAAIECLNIACGLDSLTGLVTTSLNVYL